MWGFTSDSIIKSNFNWFLNRTKLRWWNIFTLTGQVGMDLFLQLSTESLTKIGLATLILICLFQLPYGYYQLLRFLFVVGFAILAYYEYERKNIPLVIVYVALMVLFQPLATIPLGRQLWMIVDVVVAVGLIVSVFLTKNKI